ncbi:SURF1 family protein [Sandaracinobacter sp. RS1-74]|uniref:SURF1 family protein n=1 Tax=Sandaracinobacteroides sayramensis TaxID=2913411 RepID=UPI001EDA49E9|nr:SURF1 family protein [Sandaracinobacteroides sayramensis]MCG2842757.1 SURF1 family protein [Sandaracinobacteroides sayramensis]
MRPHRAFPWVPTLMVLVAVPILIGFGLWQLQRMHWKEGLLADMRAASAQPLLPIDGAIPAQILFRQVEILLDCPQQQPVADAARNAAGASGWSTRLLCRAPAGESVQLVLGWSDRPDGWAKLGANAPPPGPRRVLGTLAPAEKADYRLYARESPAPLVPVAPPTPDSLPNNHFGYAIQWFSFAAILAVVYGLWLRRWLAQRDAEA